MTTKYIIYRRLFNPDPKQKGIKSVVAKFSRTSKEEAALCLHTLQSQATSFKDAGNSSISKYRYTLYTVPDAIDTSRNADLTLDVSKARRTGRPISYELTWDLRHGVCHMLAYHRLYGAVRAEVENTAEARHTFCRQLKRIWPNAELSHK